MTVTTEREYGGRRMSQKARVLMELVDAGYRGVCDELFYVQQRIPNARNRVGELMDEGHHIESDTCGDVGRLHEPAYARYRYVHGPDRLCRTCPPRTRIAKNRAGPPPVQMTLV